MAIIFLLYAATFWFVHAKKRAAAFGSLCAATIASIGMYLYHADSSLGLNF